MLSVISDKSISVKFNDNSEKKINIEKDIQPINKQILVRLLRVLRNQGKSNLILSSSINDNKYSVGEVLQVSQGIEDIKVGDIVMYKKDWEPIKFELDGVKYSFVKSEDISCMIKNK